MQGLVISFKLIQTQGIIPQGLYVHSRLGYIHSQVGLTQGLQIYIASSCPQFFIASTQNSLSTEERCEACVSKLNILMIMLAAIKNNKFNVGQLSER